MLEELKVTLNAATWAGFIEASDTLTLSLLRV
jgi:hypothetical protein